METVLIIFWGQITTMQGSLLAIFFQNGTVKNKTGAWPSDFISIMSLVTTADVQANNFSNDRNIGGRYLMVT